MLRFLGSAILSATLAMCLVAGPAQAGGLAPPVSDCYANGKLTHHYTAAQLRGALATMPADIREYSPCYNVIQQALLQQIGPLSGGGGSGGGGSFLPTWLIVVIVILVLGGAGFGAVALRNRDRAP